MIFSDVKSMSSVAKNMNIVHNKYRYTIKTGQTGYTILMFMVTLYPLFVIPNKTDYFYFPRYIVLAFLALISFYLLFKDRVIQNHYSYIPLALFITFSLVSTMFSPFPQTAWLGINLETDYSRYTGLSTYLFCIIMFFQASNVKNGFPLLRYLVYSAALISFLAILQHFGVNLVPHEYYRIGYRPYGTFSNPNFLGTYTVFILPAPIMFYLHTNKHIWLIISALIYSALLVCLTRGAWLTFAFFLLLLLLSIYKSRHLYLPFAKIMLIIGLVTLLFLPTISKRAASMPNEVIAAIQLEEQVGSGRMYIWKQVVNLIPNHWAFGIGLDHLAYRNIVIPANSSLVDKAHNVYLDLAVSTGIFSLLAYIVFLMSIVWSAIKKGNLLFFFMITSYLVQGLFNIDIVMIMPIFWIVLGLSLAPFESTQGSLGL